MTLEFWRDVSVVWLSLFCLIGLAIPLALAAFAVKGMHALVARTPAVLGKARSFSSQARHLTETGSTRVTTPVIKAQRAATRFATTIARLRGRPAVQQEDKYR